MESTDDPNWDVEAVVQIMDIEDENINTNIETKVLHMQGLQKYHTQLETWCIAYNVEYCLGSLWWKDEALAIVGNNDLKNGVVTLFMTP